MDKYIVSAYENIKKNEALEAVHVFKHIDKLYIGLNTVFSPIIYQDTFFFTKAIPIIEKGSFLEIGCGTGLISVNAAVNGFSQVVSTDINEDAVKNVKLNAVLHNVENKLTAFVSDIFDSIPKTNEYLFDIIFWNTPFIHDTTKAITFLEKSVFGDYLKGIANYISNAKSFLKEDGRVFIGFSDTCGDIDLLIEICKSNLSKLILIDVHFIDEVRIGLYEIQFDK